MPQSLTACSGQMNGVRLEGREIEVRLMDARWGLCCHISGTVRACFVTYYILPPILTLPSPHSWSGFNLLIHTTPDHVLYHVGLWLGQFGVHCIIAVAYLYLQLFLDWLELLIGYDKYTDYTYDLLLLVFDTRCHHWLSFITSWCWSTWNSYYYIIQKIALMSTHQSNSYYSRIYSIYMRYCIFHHEYNYSVLCFQAICLHWWIWFMMTNVL